MNKELMDWGSCTVLPSPAKLPNYAHLSETFPEGLPATNLKHGQLVPCLSIVELSCYLFMMRLEQWLVPWATMLNR